MTNPFLTQAYWSGVYAAHGEWLALFIAFAIVFALASASAVALTWGYRPIVSLRLRRRSVTDRALSSPSDLRRAAWLEARREQQLRAAGRHV